MNRRTENDGVRLWSNIFDTEVLTVVNREITSFLLNYMYGDHMEGISLAGIERCFTSIRGKCLTYSCLKHTLDKFMEYLWVNNLIDPNVAYFWDSYHRIVTLLLGHDDFYDIIYVNYDHVWKAALDLLQVYFKHAPSITVEEVVSLYKTFRGFKEDTIFNHTMYYVRPDFDSGGSPANDARMFYRFMVGDVPIYLARKEMWELWYQNDPDKHQDSIGNFVVWLPKEILEDIVSLDGRLRVEIEGIYRRLPVWNKETVSRSSFPMFT